MLTSIPGLQEHLMESPEEETCLIADLVCNSTLQTSVFLNIQFIFGSSDSKGGLGGKIRWHQELEERYHWLDYPPSAIALTSNCSKRKDGAQVSPQGNRSSPLPCSTGLVRSRVRFPLLSLGSSFLRRFQGQSRPAKRWHISLRRQLADLSVQGLQIRPWGHMEWTPPK